MLSASSGEPCGPAHGSESMERPLPSGHRHIPAAASPAPASWVPMHQRDPPGTWHIPDSGAVLECSSAVHSGLPPAASPSCMAHGETVRMALRAPAHPSCNTACLCGLGPYAPARPSGYAAYPKSRCSSFLLQVATPPPASPSGPLTAKQRARPPAGTGIYAPSAPSGHRHNPSATSPVSAIWVHMHQRDPLGA